MHRLIQTGALALAVLTTGCQVTSGPTRSSAPSQTPTWEDMNLGARVAPDGKPETCRWGFKAKAGTTTWEIDRNHTTCHVSGTKARRDYQHGNPYTGTWDYVQADGTVKQGEWEYGKKVGDWSWYTSTTTMKPGIQRGDGSSSSTQTASTGSGGKLGPKAMDFGEELADPLCRLAAEGQPGQTIPPRAVNRNDCVEVETDWAPPRGNQSRRVPGVAQFLQLLRARPRNLLRLLRRRSGKVPDAIQQKRQVLGCRLEKLLRLRREYPRGK